MQSHSNKKQVFITPKGFSNLIFNQQKRGMSALSAPFSPPKTRPSNREQSIMLLRKNKKQNYSREGTPERESNSVDLTRDLYHSNKINVINLMSCSMSASPKLRSHYCKKITLTNVDKYYQFCLKKMKAICNGSLREIEKPQERPVSSSRRTRPVTPGKRVMGQQELYSGNQLKSSTNYNSVLKPSPTRTASEDLRYLQNSYSYTCPRHHQHDHESRPLHSSFSVRSPNPASKRYLQTSQQRRPANNTARMRKNQFVIDAWEAGDNVNVPEDIF